MQNSISQFVHRLIRFPSKPVGKKFESVYFRWRKLFPRIPFPIRLSNGDWWLFELDFIGESILLGGYENVERQFCSHFLLPGMTVLDIGAHHGLFSLLFSRRVGPHGRVLSFEPSAENVARFKLHMKLNRRRNVDIFECALGEEEQFCPLYTVPTNSVLNSLRPPDTLLPVTSGSVRVRRVDDIMTERQIDRVDFVKLDVEGGELGVLKGAPILLTRRPRPVFLCEILGERTRPWGYSGIEIVSYLRDRSFKWFALDARSGLSPVSPSATCFDGNFVAIPEESKFVFNRVSLENL
jgi:FkbM family methyltransferase